MGSAEERVREPAVAGMFYPGEPAALRASVEGYLAVASAPAADTPVPKALISPHAGYVYSGPVAASAFSLLARVRERVRRVVLLGPSHRVYLRGLAAPSLERFATPLGEIEIDRAAIDAVRDLSQVQISDAPHRQEHSLEVQLPFLQAILDDFTLVPFAVGDASTSEVAEVLERLWGGDETLLLVSTDLSHYYDYETARRLDAATSRAIEALAPEGLGEESACGRVPVRGLLAAARRHSLTARILDVRSSGDTAGTRDRVVGYGAYAFA